MEILSLEFLLALLYISGINLLLSGDNAIVIALASKNLPDDKQKKAIFWGTIGAIGVRVVFTLIIASLLGIPGLHLIGGLLLIWISYKLLIEEDDDQNVDAKSTLFGAIQTIIIADAAMGFDNVLAIAAAADNNFLLIILGLLISIPIIMWGSTLFIKLLDRFPWIIYVGSGLLAYTSAEMIIKEEFVHPFFEHYQILKWTFIAVVIVGVLITGKKRNDRVQGNIGEEEERQRA